MLHFTHADGLYSFTFQISEYQLGGIVGTLTMINLLALAVYLLGFLFKITEDQYNRERAETMD